MQPCPQRLPASPRRSHEVAAEGFENYDMEWWHFSYTVENPVPFDRPITAAQ